MLHLGCTIEYASYGDAYSPKQAKPPITVPGLFWDTLPPSVSPKWLPKKKKKNPARIKEILRDKEFFVL